MLIRYLVANMLKSQAQEAVRSKVEQAVTDQARNIAEMKQGREMPACELAMVFANSLEASGVVDQMEGVISMQCACVLMTKQNKVFLRLPVIRMVSITKG